MIRKMAYVGFSYLLGLFFASFFISEAVIAVCAAAVLFSVVVLILKGRNKLVYLVCSIFFAIGSIYYIGFDRLCYQKVISLNGSEVSVYGVLTDYTDYNNDRSIYFIDGKINGSVDAKVYCYGDAKTCDIGDEIIVKGIAAIPQDSFSFSSLKYYKSKGIFLTIDQPDISIISSDKLPIKRVMCRYREIIHEKMRTYLDADSLSLVDAIMFGDKSNIESDTKKLMYRAGIGHIMAVSGVHLSIVCSLFWFVLQFSGMKKSIRFILVLIPMFAFVMLSGASNSVIRAAIMLILVYGSSLFNRRADLMNSLGIAVILLTIGSPFTVMDASFILSAAGVIGVGAIAPAVIKTIEEKHKVGKAARSMITSAVVSAVVFPICFLYFDEVSIVSPISNLLLIPVCSVILVCGTIVVFSGGIGALLVPLMKICSICSKIVLAVARMLGGARFTYIAVSNSFSYWAIIAVLIVTFAAAIYFHKVKTTAFVYTAACVLCIFAIFVYRFIPSDHIDIAFIKSGSSSAIVINDKKNASVIDLNKGGLCADKIFRYLDRKGIYRIEMLGLLADAQASVSTYSARSGLYDIGTIIYPSEYEKFVQGFIDAGCKCYDESKTAVITMPDYTLHIMNNNTLTLNVNGCDILIYDGRTDQSLTGEYDVLIEYAGSEPCENLRGKIQIFSDSRIKAAADRNSKLFYGENVIIKAFDNSFEAEVLSCAGYY
ncbi:MAG: ComEC/Rec2 family competence protein [Oscillospiraceae bacterium]